MEKVNYRITLDVHKGGIQKKLSGFFTGDVVSRRIAIGLTAGGVSCKLEGENIAALMYVTKPSGVTNYGECDIVDNTVYYDVFQADTDMEGIVEMQLKVMSSDMVLYAPRFSLEVQMGNSDDVAVASPQFTALEAAILKANEGKITPKGEWSPDVTYKELDYVTYKDSSFVALKPSIGREPVNGEYWMVSLDGVIDFKLLADGSVPAGDAKQLGGKDAALYAFKDDVANVDKKVAEIANNQIPEEYLEAAVDKYVEDNSAGFATQASLEAVETDLKSDLGKSYSELKETLDNYHPEYLVKKYGAYQPKLEQGSFDANGLILIKSDNPNRVRTALPIYTNNQKIAFQIPYVVVVWVYDVNSNMEVVGDSGYSIGGTVSNSIVQYESKSEYVFLVFKLRDAEKQPITVDDLTGFMIIDSCTIRQDAYSIDVPMERGRFASGAYNNTWVYGSRRSSFFVKTNGAKYLAFRYPKGFAFNEITVYYFDENMEYMKFWSATKAADYVEVEDGTAYIKFYFGTDAVIESINVSFLGATQQPTLVKNIQIAEDYEKIIFDTVKMSFSRFIKNLTQGYIRMTEGVAGTVGTDPARCVSGYVEFNDNSETVDIVVKNGYKVSIHEYASELSYIGRVVSNATGTYTLTRSATSVYRFQVCREDESNMLPSEVPADVLKCGSTVQDFTTSRLILPSNYSPTGNPVPLILWMDGSGSENFGRWDGSMSEVKVPYLKYLADEGFAVFSIFAWGRYYSDKYTACGNAYPYPIPTNLNNIRKGLEFICDRFNIDANNIHIMSKSQGGQCALYFATNPVWDFKSIGMFAPVLDYLSMPGEPKYKDTRLAIAEDLNLDDDTGFFGSSDYLAYSDDGRAFLERNMVKLAGMNEAWTALCGGTLSENFNKAMDDCKLFWTEKRWNNAENADIYNNHQYVKFAKVPVKIWGASDDAATPFGKMAEVVSQLQNGGTEAHLREFPRGTGGHSCADVGATKQDVITELGITHTNVPIGWIENVAWIRSKMPK